MLLSILFIFASLTILGVCTINYGRNKDNYILASRDVEIMASAEEVHLYKDFFEYNSHLSVKVFPDTINCVIHKTYIPRKTISPFAIGFKRTITEFHIDIKNKVDTDEEEANG